jgi:hypothetical protein
MRRNTTVSLGSKRGGHALEQARCSLGVSLPPTSEMTGTPLGFCERRNFVDFTMQDLAL